MAATQPLKTILVVDDERVIADTLAMILNRSGYDAYAAYDGLTGLKRARELKPDIVLSGFKNGDGPNGIEMAITIREEMPDTRILLFSGVAKSLGELMQRVRARGHDLLLVEKPLHPVDILHWCKSGELSEAYRRY
jgi:DNA-binding response OmpR family regulator